MLLDKAAAQAIQAEAQTQELGVMRENPEATRRKVLMAHSA
jgi:hypothetical protein